ncbi:MAG: hypothetical protein PHR16_00690 [Methylovulum sp.]|nr:hypothetical protein [Methylovulum sp.]
MGLSLDVARRFRAAWYQFNIAYRHHADDIRSIPFLWQAATRHCRIEKKLNCNIKCRLFGI